MSKNPYKATKAQEKKYLNDMQHLAQLLLMLYEDKSFKSIGRSAKLNPRTVSRLKEGQTRLPQFRTMQKLAAGVGVNIAIEENDIYMSLKKKADKQLKTV